MAAQSIHIGGNLTAAPQLRFTPQGKPWVTFTIAVTDRIRDDAGAWRDGETLFQRAVAWGDLADHLAELPTGTAVLASGRLVQREWLDADGITKRYAVDLVCSDVGASLTRATVVVTRVKRAAAAEVAA